MNRELIEGIRGYRVDPGETVESLVTGQIGSTKDEPRAGDAIAGHGPRAKIRSIEPSGWVSIEDGEGRRVPGDRHVSRLRFREGAWENEDGAIYGIQIEPDFTTVERFRSLKRAIAWASQPLGAFSLIRSREIFQAPKRWRLPSNSGSQELAIRTLPEIKDRRLR